MTRRKRPPIVPSRVLSRANRDGRLKRGRTLALRDAGNAPRAEFETMQMRR
jgi:hypothetical protein